jgi:hypothetical protein
VNIRTTAGIPATAETTGIYDLEQRYQQQQKQRGRTSYRMDISTQQKQWGYTNYSRDTSNSRNNGDIRTTAGIPAIAEITGIYDLKSRDTSNSRNNGIYDLQQGYQQQQKQRGYTTYSRDTSNSRNNGDIRPTAGIPATAKTTEIYDLQQGYQQQQKQRGYTTHSMDTSNSRNKSDI